MDIQIKRVYESPSSNDGKRILVDRLWPRGLTKDEAQVDVWLKNIAPTASLRQWFGHDPSRWQEFKKRYQKELEANYQLVSELKKQAETENITLVYGAKDTAHNQAVVLKEYLEQSK